MFKGLRLRLTLLYLAVALALIGLVAAGAYQLVGSYFDRSTDLALKHRMSQEFQVRNLSVPPELMAADQVWSSSRGHVAPPMPSPTAARAQDTESHISDFDEDNAPSVPQPTATPNRAGTTTQATGAGPSEETEAQDTYDAELAAIFVLPLNTQARVISDTNTVTPPFNPDSEAVHMALAFGSDVRTVYLPNGPRVRLLTYRISGTDGPVALQLGRTLGDQDRALSQLLAGLLALGGVCAVLMGLGSWWLAGRSLDPAQHAWERQQAFVANASHELRTPLTLMRASAEVALRSLRPDDADRRELLQDVLDENDHMNRLVEDLLLLSRLDAGRLVLEHKVISLPELLADVRRQMSRVTNQRGVDLAVPQADGAVWGDPTRLRQVLLILLDNALRYTPSGGRIGIAVHDQGRLTHIVVADTGSGIAPEHLQHVFDRFYRIDTGRSANGGGSGLGLSIAKGLVDAQHGTISIASRVGAGTQVTVALPSANLAAAITGLNSQHGTIEQHGEGEP